MTYAVIAANVVMFGFELASGVELMSPTAQQVFDVGASAPASTLGGEPWRLVSSMFLHFGLLHLALNMACLWQGRIVELLLGRGAFAAVYLLAGLAGGVATLAFGGRAVSAGASGAVFGVFGAFAGFLVVRRRSIPEDAWRATARGIGTFLVINLAFGLSVPGISMSAHVGGLIAGFVIAAALLARRTGPPSLGRTALVTLAATAVIAAAFFALPRPPPPLPLASFGRVEHEVIERGQQLDDARRAGTLSDAAAADAVERDVLAPWRRACAPFERAPTASDRSALGAALAAYCDARATSWRTYVDALRAEGAERERLWQRYQAEQQEVARRIQDAERAAGAD